VKRKYGTEFHQTSFMTQPGEEREEERQTVIKGCCRCEEGRITMLGVMSEEKKRGKKRKRKEKGY